VEEKMRPTFQTELFNSKTVVTAAAAAWALGVSVQPAYAQPDRAEAAMRAGNGPEAEAAHSITLQSDPNNLKALVGRGTARAWQKNWSGAINDLERALAIDPDNLEALVALGYANAWSGQYPSAESNFQRALALAPDSQSAKKGLAYSAYWAGRNEDAAQQFEKLAYEIPDDPEPFVGVGMARLANGNAGRAAKAYKSALAIDPAREDAKKGLTAAYDYPALAEVSVWGGTTSGGGDAGLRLVELASWVTPRTRIWAKYDNGLSLDNPVLARTGANAETFYGGLLQQIGDDFLALGEIGYRNLPAGENQEIYKVEGTFLSKLGATKAGVQISPHSAGFTDRLFYAGQNFRVNKNLSFEPTVYLARTGASRDDEWRLVGYGEYKTDDYSIGVGIGGGDVSSANPLADGGVFVAYANASIRVGGWHRLHFNVTREEAPLNSFTRFLAGVTFRLPRN
jgi:tetratricopeptide (TPR) repeat protein